MVDSNFCNINWIMWPFHSKCLQWHIIVFRRKPQLFRFHQSLSGLGCADFWVYMPWLSHDQPCFYHRKFPTFSPKAMVSYLWTYDISSFLGSIFSFKHCSSIITFSKYSLTTFTWIRYHYLYLSLIFQSTLSLSAIIFQQYANYMSHSFLCPWSRSLYLARWKCSVFVQKEQMPLLIQCEEYFLW